MVFKATSGAAVVLLGGASGCSAMVGGAFFLLPLTALGLVPAELSVALPFELTEFVRSFFFFL